MQMKASFDGALRCFDIISGRNALFQRMQQLHPTCRNHFISIGWMKEESSRNTFSFWMCNIFNQTYNLATDQDCRATRLNVHGVGIIALVLLFKKNFAVSLVL